MTVLLFGARLPESDNSSRRRRTGGLIGSRSAPDDEEHRARTGQNVAECDERRLDRDTHGMVPQPRCIDADALPGISEPGLRHAQTGFLQQPAQFLHGVQP